MKQTMTSSAPQTTRRLRLRLTGLGRLGEALAEHNGKPVFVFGGIPGETVDAEVIREHRGHIAARVVDVIDASPDRVEAPCPYVGACTGCQWQHIRYGRQLEMKRNIVVDALSRIGGIVDISVEPTLASPQQLGYRNHARFTVWRDHERGGRLGYVHREARRHVEIDECLLMAPWINETLRALQGHVAETTQLSMRCGVNTGTWMIQPTLENPDMPLATGQRHYEESLGGRTFRVSSPSFFQVNTPQAERMAALVLRELAPTGGETLVDAYAGVGTFAVLASPHVRRVVAIEESSAAIDDAKVNVDGLPNVELRKGRTEDVLLEMAASEASPIDSVILDPSRSGCMPGTLDALVTAAPRRIAYVSCDPETLARDLKTLTAGPFRIDLVQPVDMFPQTHHVECVVMLSLDDDRRTALEARSQLVLASASPRRREIMERLGLPFDLSPTDAEPPDAELAHGEADALAVAKARATAKARAAAGRRASGTVIAADTVVELDGRILGKPRDAVEATAMLRALRGREHRVLTAVVLLDAATGKSVDGYRASRVHVRDLTDDEIAAYVASGDPFDKAGAYAVQNEAFHPADEVRGCYLNVVGLPVCTLLKVAGQFGLRLRPKVEGPWPAAERCPDCAAGPAR